MREHLFGEAGIRWWSLSGLDKFYEKTLK